VSRPCFLKKQPKLMRVIAALSWQENSAKAKFYLEMQMDSIRRFK